MRRQRANSRTAGVPDRSYQPRRAELREDLPCKGTFDEAMEVLVRPVKVRSVMPAKRQIKFMPSNDTSFPYGNVNTLEVVLLRLIAALAGRSKPGIAQSLRWRHSQAVPNG